MNYGVLHNRRAKRSNEMDKDERHALPINKIAQQMGVDPKTLGKEAENVWNMLEDMSANDPKAYKEFIENQFKSNADIGTTEGANSSDSKRGFVPIPGFVVKTSINKTQKLFINCCSHRALDIPKYPNDQPVPEDTRAVPSTNNISIPLAIGEMRIMKDAAGMECHVIDVVFHPWVMARSEWDVSFKGEAVALAITWIGKETGRSIDRPGKFIKSKYKGGTGQGKFIQACFFAVPDQNEISPAKQTKKPNEMPNPKHDESLSKSTPISTMKDPMQLLNQIKTNGNVEDDSTNNFDLSVSKATDSMPKKKLIEIIDSSSADEPLDTRTVKLTKKKTTTVKKGFLNKSKKPLYPNGSKEGKGPSAYVKLLERSKVVDLNDPNVKLRSDKSECKSSKEQTSRLKKPEEDHYDYEFEQLCMEAEPDLKETHSIENDSFAESLKMLQQMTP